MSNLHIIMIDADVTLLIKKAPPPLILNDLKYTQIVFIFKAGEGGRQITENKNGRLRNETKALIGKVSY